MEVATTQKRNFVVSLVAVIMLIAPLSDISRYLAPVHGWWDNGHMIVTSKSIRLMPDPWKSFLSYYEFYLNETSVYPDSIYKKLDPEEDFRHYIDLEIWDLKKPETGTFPYAVELFATDAVNAMRAGDWNKVLYDLGRVSHYVADVHQPYHSTVDYNPRTKTGKALHAVLDAAMEVHYRELNTTTAKDAGPPEPIQNLTSFCLQIAWQSHSFLKRVNQILIDEGREWSPELSNIVQNRTNSAIIAVSRVWYTTALRAAVIPPRIPEPNTFKIDVIGIPKQLDPDKEVALSIVVTDKIGICTPVSLRATLGNTPLSTYELSYMPDPLGKYSIPLPKETLSRLRGTEASLSLAAERPGYVSAKFETMIKVEGLSPQFLQTTVAVVAAVIVAAVVLGTAHLRRRRKQIVIDK